MAKGAAQPKWHGGPEPRRRRGDEGRALITALLAVAVLSVLAAAAAGSATAALRAGIFWREDVAARYLAESGLHHALAALATGARPSALAPPPGLLLPGDSYAVTIGFTEPRLAVATASGTRRQRQRRVHGVFHVDGLPPEYFRDQDPTPPDGIVTGLCRSEDGPPVPFPASSARTPPASVPVSGDLNLESGSLRLGPGAFAYRQVRLRGTGVLRLEGPAVLYVSQDLTLLDRASLETAGAVTVYVEGDLAATGSARWTAGGPTNVYIGGRTSWEQDASLTAAGPVDLVLLAPRDGDRPAVRLGDRASLDWGGTGGQVHVAVFLAGNGSHGPVRLEGEARLRGGVYAPGADLSLAPGVKVRGSLVACRVSGAGGGGDGKKGGGGGKKGGGGGNHKEKDKSGDGAAGGGGGAKGGGRADVRYDLGHPEALAERGWYR